MIHALLDMGADVTIQDVFRMLPCEYVIYVTHTELARFFIDKTKEEIIKDPRNAVLYPHLF